MNINIDLEFIIYKNRRHAVFPLLARVLYVRYGLSLITKKSINYSLYTISVIILTNG